MESGNSSLKEGATIVKAVAAAAFLAAMLALTGCSPQASPTEPPPGGTTQPAPTQGQAIEVRDPSSTYTGTTLGVYMKIANNGQGSAAVVGARAPGLGEVSLHRSTMENGIAKMQKVDRVDLPAGSTVEFKQGSYHIMVQVPADKQLKVGDEWDLVLVLEGGREVGVKVPVNGAGTTEKFEGHQGHMN